jgi:signal transduction histidine kinase
MRWIRPTEHTPSLALRLGLGFVAALLALAGVWGALQWLLGERFADRVVLASLRGQTHDLIDGLRLDAQGRVLGVELGGIEGHGFDAFRANLKYRVLDADGRVVAGNDAQLDSLLPAVPLARQDGHYERRALAGADFHIAAFREKVAGHTLTLQLGRSDRFAELALEALRPAVGDAAVLMAAVAVAAFAVVGWGAVRGVLAPIRRVADAAGAVGHANLAARLPEGGVPAEMLPLVRAFNGVLVRLQQVFDAQQRFFADAAHELKTPLALVRSRLEAAAAVPERGAMIEQLDLMARQVQQLLHLAEAADGSALRRESLDPADTAREVLRALSWKAEQRGVALRTLAEPGAPRQLDADSGALFALLRNLVENAIEFSPTEGTVTLRIGSAGIDVEDEGPGIAPEHRERAFERFWRAPGQQRPGAGLGLALARQIALAHGWQLAADMREAGPGARLRLRW